MRSIFFTVWIAVFGSTGTSLLASETLQTHYERSDFKQTGRYDEVIRLCDAYQSQYPKQVRCETFGDTPEGRPLLALVVAPKAIRDGTQAKTKGRTVVLAQGGIHAGEIDGKDAGFLFLREFLRESKWRSARDNLVWIFVPVFNVDGHERFKAWNRPNQRGPEQMGWRTTAQNYNLNRDYMKADAPEMQAMLRLINQWDPLVTIDMHVTDGAQFEHDVSLMIEPKYAGDETLRGIGTTMQSELLKKLESGGHLPLPFYPSFVENDNPASGFADGVAQARFSTGYFLQRNRFGILLETHAWRSYQHRVQTTLHTLQALAQLASENGDEWRLSANKADQAAAKLSGATIALEHQATASARTIAFRGYQYSRTPSEVSGSSMVHYDESKPAIWNIPLRDEIVPSLQIKLPHAGYWIPPAYRERAKRYFDLHQIQFREINQAVANQSLDVFRAESVTLGSTSFEGRQSAKLQGSWKSTQGELPARGLFVPIAQANARLVAALLEPQAPDSLAAWGEFNTAWEQKEYMESYVAEDIARTMLQDAAIKAEFEKFLADNPDKAKSPEARLNFFHRKHASWDERLNLYPVFRLDQPLTQE